MKTSKATKYAKPFPPKPISDNSHSPAKSETGSRILLVMIQNEKNYNVPHDSLYSLFKPYGDVRKVSSLLRFPLISPFVRC